MLNLVLKTLALSLALCPFSFSHYQRALKRVTLNVKLLFSTGFSATVEIALRAISTVALNMVLNPVLNPCSLALDLALAIQKSFTTHFR